VKHDLLWGAGPGEIRAGLVEDGNLAEFRLVRLRRNEEMLLVAGERYTARLISRTGNGLALVDIGAGQTATLRNPPPLPEGALIEVEMVRAPYAEPGNWKLPSVRYLPDISPVHQQGTWHFSAEPWELFLLDHAPLVDTIICPDIGSAGEVREVLGADAPAIRAEPGRIEDADFDSLIEQAVSGIFPLPDGVLTIERTRAMTMIDIDGSVDGETLNLQAAREIPRLLRLLDIGGQVGIDFVAMESKAARQAVIAALDEASHPLGAFERTAINGFGFCQIVRRKTGPSVPELLCGARRAALSDESRTIALLREAGRSTGFGPRRLVAPPAIIDLIKKWPEETAALRSSLGVEIELVSDPAAIGYGHVHVSQA
jgi:ribonuclease G